MSASVLFIACQVANDPLAVSKLIHKMDKDNSGVIRENEFVAYFREVSKQASRVSNRLLQLRKEDFEKRLKQFQEHRAANLEIVTYDASVL